MLSCFEINVCNLTQKPINIFVKSLFFCAMEISSCQERLKLQMEVTFEEANCLVKTSQFVLKYLKLFYRNDLNH